MENNIKHNVKMFIDKAYRTKNIAGISIKTYGWCVLLFCNQHIKKISGSSVVTYQENIDLKIIEEGLMALKSECNVTVYINGKDTIDIIQHNKECCDEYKNQLDIIEGFMNIHKVKFIDVSSNQLDYDDTHLMRLATNKAIEEVTEYISDLVV